MRKYQSLEGLRGLACLAVIASHFLFTFLPYLGHNLYPPSPGLVAKYPFEELLSHAPFTLLFNGNFAVSIFFVLTGFVLTAKFHENGDTRILLEGAIKRYPRLVLPAFVSVLFVFVIVYTGQMRNHLAIELNAAGWVLDFYKEPADLLHSIYVGLIGAPILGDTLLNSPLWTLKIELVGSFLIFATYSLFGRNHKLLILLCFIILSFVLGSPLYYMSFVLGSFIHVFAKWLIQRQAISFLILVLGLVLGSINYSSQFSILTSMPLPNLLPYSVNFNTDKLLFWYTIGAVLTVTGIVGFKPIAKLLASKVFTHIGKISFSAYLLHWPIILSFSFGAVRKSMLFTHDYLTSVMISFISTYVVILILSILFYRFVDKPSIGFSGWLKDYAMKGKSPSSKDQPVTTVFHE